MAGKLEEVLLELLYNEFDVDEGHTPYHLVKSLIAKARSGFPRKKLSIIAIDIDTILELRDWYDEWLGDSK